jgi:hypothetical protein
MQPEPNIKFQICYPLDTESIKLPWESSHWEKIKTLLLPKQGTTYKDIDIIMGKLSNTPPGYSFSNLMDAYHNSDLSPSEKILNSKKTTILSKEYVAGVIIPYICYQILHGPEKFQDTKVKILKSKLEPNMTTLWYLKRDQITVLMACAFFGLFDLYDRLPEGENIVNYAKFNFRSIFETRDMFALSCLLNYFNTNAKTKLLGSIKIIRRAQAPISVDDPVDKLTNSAENISPVLCITGDCIIDKAENTLVAEPNAKEQPEQPQQTLSSDMYVSFSEAIVGSESMCARKTETRSAQNILFCTMPENFILLLVSEKLDPLESMICIGSKVYSSYSKSTAIDASTADIKFEYPLEDKHARMSDQTIARAIVFVNFTRADSYAKYRTDFNINLLKACSAFNILPSMTPLYKKKLSVSSGYYFKETAASNNSDINFIIQLLAASESNLCLFWYTLDNVKFAQRIYNFIHVLRLKKINVGELYKAYLIVLIDIHRDYVNGYNTINLNTYDIFGAILEKLKL